MKNLSRRNFLKSGTAAVGALTFLAPQTRSTAKPLVRPNILTILCDDMGFSDIGCYGGEIETPNLDALAKEGVRFTQAYNTAKCYPSRACLLTGAYFQQTDRDFTRTVTTGEVLKKAGYHTYWAGKHHAGFDPRTRGFDRFYGFLGGALNYFNPGDKARPGEDVPAHIGTQAWILDEKEQVKPFVPKDPKFYTTDAFTDAALGWLDESEKADDPFYLYMAYNAPHWPLHAWPEDIAKCKGRYDAGYEAVRNARYKRQIKSGLFDAKTTPLSEPEYGKKLWDEQSADEKKLEAKRMEIYAAMIQRLDWNIGRLIEKLRSQGKLDNTLITFSSDNGCSPEYPQKRVKNGNMNGEPGSVNSYLSLGKSWATVSNTPLRKWKTSSHEGGICTAMIAHWPARIKNPGRFYREPVHLIDFMPTFMEIAEATFPTKNLDWDIPPLEGASFTPSFAGDPLKRKKKLFWQYGGGSALRDGNWKLVEGGVGLKWELYDLACDRTETNDLAAKHPDRLKAMSEEWNERLTAFNKYNPPPPPKNKGEKTAK